MTIHHDPRAIGATPMLRLEDLRRAGKEEPRVRDLRLAELLGFAKPAKIRELITRNQVELLTYGELPTDNPHGGEKTRGRGRPGTTYWLNEGQALVLCALSRTPMAAKVRGEIITVFMAWRRSPWNLSAMPIAPLERRALRDICRHGDIIQAEVALDPLRAERDRHPAVMPFLLAPATDAVMEAFGSFEAEAEDLEDGDNDGGMGWGSSLLVEGEHEPDQDDEDSLGSTHATDQTNWIQGMDGDREHEDGDLEPSLGALNGDEFTDQCEWAWSGTHDLENEPEGRERQPSVAEPWDMTSPYAMVVRGDCMAPEVPDGSRVVVDPSKPPMPGDLVCIYHHVPGKVRSMVKRLVAMPADHKSDLILEMINPAFRFGVLGGDVIAVHRAEPAPAGLLTHRVHSRSMTEDREMVRAHAEHLAEVARQRQARRIDLDSTRRMLGSAGEATFTGHRLPHLAD